MTRPLVSLYLVLRGHWVSVAVLAEVVQAARLEGRGPCPHESVRRTDTLCSLLSRHWLPQLVSEQDRLGEREGSLGEEMESGGEQGLKCRTDRGYQNKR